MYNVFHNASENIIIGIIILEYYDRNKLLHNRKNNTKYNNTK